MKAFEQVFVMCTAIFCWIIATGLIVDEPDKARYRTDLSRCFLGLALMLWMVVM